MLSQILDEVFFFFKKNFWVLVNYIVPVSIVMIVVGEFLAQTYFPMAEMPTGREPTEAELQAFMQSMQGRFMINGLLNPLYIAGLIFLLGQIVKEVKITFGQILTAAIRKWLSLLVVYFFTGLLSLVGFIFFILPGVYIFSRLCLAPYYVVLENKDPFSALFMSVKSTGEYTWTLFGGIVVIAGSLLLLQLFSSIAIPEGSMAGVVIFSVVFNVLWSILNIFFFRFYTLISGIGPDKDESLDEKKTNDDDDHVQ